jgi:cob(I)alamin adenosyltransferase
MRYYTGRGDDGSTGLLFSSLRVAKDDPRIEVLGDLDEAVAAVGVARAELGSSGTWEGVVRALLLLQRGLFVAGAEAAAPEEAWGKLEPGVSRVTPGMVAELERAMEELGPGELPPGFVLPGEDRGSAFLDLARSVVRRAERRAVRLARAGGLPPDSLLPAYLNRASSLLWVLARTVEGRARPVRG